MDLESVKLFGPVTNFVLSLSVTLYGYFAWFRGRNLGSGPRFSLLAYRCWWASWLCWALAWGILLIAALLQLDPVPIGLRIVTLVFDNLNSVFMFLVYFVVTRGNDFDKRRTQVAFVQIAGSLFLGCVVLYMLARLIGLNFAYEVHRTWSLCLGVFAPMLIGWACHLRYNTSLILVVGSAYGFMQPFIYTTELMGVQSVMSPESLALYKPIIAMTLGGLKVLWAILFMQVLAHGASSGETLVLNKTAVHFYFFRKWEKKILGHALVLGVAYCCLLIGLVIVCIRLERGLDDLATALGIVGGFMALLDWFWKLWDKGTQNGIGISSKGKRSLPANFERQTTVGSYITSEMVCNSKLGDMKAKSSFADNSH